VKIWSPLKTDYIMLLTQKHRLAMDSRTDDYGELGILNRQLLEISLSLPTCSVHPLTSTKQSGFPS